MSLKLEYLREMRDTDWFSSQSPMDQPSGVSAVWGLKEPSPWEGVGLAENLYTYVWDRGT